MERATSAVLASLVAAKLVVEWNYMAFATDACIENKSLLWFESQRGTHAAAAHAFGSTRQLLGSRTRDLLLPTSF